MEGHKNSEGKSTMDDASGHLGKVSCSYCAKVTL